MCPQGLNLTVLLLFILKDLILYCLDGMYVYQNFHDESWYIKTEHFSIS